MTLEVLETKEEISDSPVENFLFALKAQETKRQYPKRLKIFFDWGLNHKLSLEEQSLIFYKNSKKNLN
ncbi:MAG: hypothetical protein ACPKPY_09595 [Nitrososphaeraceae archaeon]